MATYKATSLRTFYDTTEKHLRCLQTLGENDNQTQVLSILRSKLPRSVLMKLEELKPVDESWTLKNFRKLLNEHISRLEACDLQMELYHKQDESSKYGTNRSSPNSFTANNNYTGETLLSNEKIKTKFGRKCIFCNEDHWSDECQKFPDIQS